ncbi:MAG TPA: hypothetical protein VGM42_07170 [Rhodopila sp.]|jgi:hypothetical protein
MMPEPKAHDFAGNYEYPTAEDAPRRQYQLAEGMVMFDVRPASAEEVAMCVQIDEIHDQLARDIPKLQHEMDELLLRVRRPGRT